MARWGSIVALSFAAFAAGAAFVLFFPEQTSRVADAVRSGGESTEPAAGPAAGPGQEATPVVFAIARTEDVPTRIEAIGDTVAAESVLLTARVAGPVEELFFDGGENVAAGDVLVRLDPAEVEGELALALAEASELRGALQRAEQLAGDGTGPQAVADDLRRRTEAADAAVASARERLASFEIRAPFGGRLGLRTISTGALVQPGDEIVRIDAVDPIDIRFSVPERYLASIQQGASVAATAAAFPDEVFEGAVAVVEPAVDPLLRTVRVEARIPNPDGKLFPGKLMAVDLTLDVAEDAVVVPAVAVRIEGSVQFVYRDADGTAERVEVTTGQRLSDRIVVAQGLQPGDRIVVEGLVELADGDAIADSAQHAESEATATEGAGG